MKFDFCFLFDDHDNQIENKIFNYYRNECHYLSSINFLTNLSLIFQTVSSKNSCSSANNIKICDSAGTLMEKGRESDGLMRSQKDDDEYKKYRELLDWEDVS